MANDEAYEKFRAMRDSLTKIDDPGTQAPPAQAFVGDEGPVPVQTQTPPDLSKPAQDVPGMLMGIGAGMAGESAALHYVKSLPIPTKYKLVANMAAGVVGGGAAAFATDLGWQNMRRQMGDVTGPDTFEQTLAISSKTASDQAAGGVWGPLLGSAVGKTSMRAKVDDERLHLMSEVQSAMKRTYERIGGAPLLEDMRGRWSPMRILKPFETELADHAVSGRLRAAGLDPQMARRVVLQGGYTGADLVDNWAYNIMQAVSEGSFASRKYMQNYQGNRNKLYGLMLDDLSAEFSAAVPEEKLGQAVRTAVNGNFNLPNAIMSSAMNSVRAYVKPTYKVNMQGVKTYFKQQGISEHSPIGMMVYEQPNTTSFDAIYRLRSNLSSMMHALDADPAMVAEAQKVAKTLDNSMVKQLPVEVQDHYRLATQADDVLNQGQFKDKFVEGLIKDPRSNRAYGKYLLANGDVENFRKLERASGKGPADMVRSGISESVLDRAVDPKTGALSPAMLHQGLNEHGKYGRYFLEATLGPKWIKNTEMFQHSMETLLDAAKGRDLGSLGLNSIKYASVAPLLWDLYHGQIDKETAIKFGLVFTTPRLVGKMLTSPRATENVFRLSQMAATGTNPHRFSRLVARTAEALGVTPEMVAAAGNLPGITPIQQMRKGLSEGRLPSTGSPMADAVLNPAGAMRDMAAPSGLPGPPPGQLGETSQ